MRSKLKMFYDKKDEIDLFETKSYLMFTNPFYQVNKCIQSINADLNKNYIKNLQDLKIISSLNTFYTCSYNVEDNSLISKNYISDIFGLLHVASNDREKEGIGLIDSNNSGVGLNDGLTALLASHILVGKEIYPIEKIVAKTLLLINEEIITNSYFNNNSSLLKEYKIDILELNKILDEYHNNYLRLEFLDRKKNELTFRMFKSKKEIDEINDLIYILRVKNEDLIYKIIIQLTTLVAYSEIDYSKKAEIIKTINDDFNSAYNDEKLRYLETYTDEFKFMTYSKMVKVRRK